MLLLVDLDLPTFSNHTLLHGPALNFSNYAAPSGPGMHKSFDKKTAAVHDTSFDKGAAAQPID